MFVTLIWLLKHLVSQIVEKNKSLNLAEMLSLAFICLWLTSKNLAEVFLRRSSGFSPNIVKQFSSLFFSLKLENYCNVK